MSNELDIHIDPEVVEQLRKKLEDLMETQGEDFYVVTFDSFTDAVTMVSNVQDKFKDRRWYPTPQTEAWNHKYIGRTFHSWQDVQKACSSAWDEGLATYEEMIRKLRDLHLTPPKSIRRKAAWSEDGGDEVDLDRLKRGQPYWRTTHRDHRPGPVSITVMVHVAGCMFQDSKSLLWPGAAAVALTELLESAGYRVELWCVTAHAGCFNGDRKAGAVMGTPIKLGMDPLNVSSLINIVSGWCYRTIHFAGLFLIDDEMVTPGDRQYSGVGYHLSLNDFMVRQFTQDENVLVCSDELRNEADAIEWIKEQVAKIL